VDRDLDETVNVFHVRNCKFVRLALYRSRPTAFADLGLEE
jgi:hypothetical protein